ncbi:hypothetical protein [Peribacillus simplex]|uniref:hypothetical protein n=2 Tax=Peribacillus simplex TaxID=1478 RepID=UPI003D2A64A8
MAIMKHMVVPAYKPFRKNESNCSLSKNSMKTGTMKHDNPNIHTPSLIPDIKTVLDKKAFKELLLHQQHQTISNIREPENTLKNIQTLLNSIEVEGDLDWELLLPLTTEKNIIVINYSAKKNGKPWTNYLRWK